MAPPRAKEGFLSRTVPHTAVVSPGGRKADGSADGGRWVGIFDVFGFEIARRNSFEQLCISFTSSGCRFALRAAFLAQAAAYAAEGVEVSTVPPPALLQDNLECVKLISERLLPALNSLSAPSSMHSTSAAARARRRRRRQALGGGPHLLRAGARYGGELAAAAPAVPGGITPRAA